MWGTPKKSSKELVGKKYWRKKGKKKNVQIIKKMFGVMMNRKTIRSEA